ncbi:CLUMA_CG002097, isoform A [Clunio marinus]|uniref:CLUMA_CG002097, isoform A n=1 Tax=Clunio marinus TaxID=568069 RepID=A0A1J1HPB7_9DIPT|nr:CLUMA_CG002097, isoform A [Clunio marinus]
MSHVNLYNSACDERFVCLLKVVKRDQIKQVKRSIKSENYFIALNAFRLRFSPSCHLMVKFDLFPNVDVVSFREFLVLQAKTKRFNFELKHEKKNKNIAKQISLQLSQ